VGIDPDDGVHQDCEHGHGPFLLSGRAVPVRTGTGLGAHTQRHICDESHARSSGRGQASDQASKVSQAGAGDPGRHVKTKAHPQAARSFEGQPKITSTDPGTSPGSGPIKASQIV
jgi:hypothetical protein